MADENPPTVEAVDLFGQPILPLRERRGRRSFRKDKENQDFVAVRAAAGWSQAMIATAIGCDEKTLRKHFSRELHQGQLIVEGAMLDVLWMKVKQGHTPSVRQLQDRLDRVVAPTPQKAEEEEAAPRQGKKERRLADAGRPTAGYDDLYKRMRPQ